MNWCIFRNKRYSRCLKISPIKHFECLSSNKSLFKLYQTCLIPFHPCVFGIFVRGSPLFSVFTGSRTCAGCVQVAAWLSGKRRSAPWGRPASYLWSPPLDADGSGSSRPAAQSPLSGSVSWCRPPHSGPSSPRHSSAGSPSPSQRHLGQDKERHFYKWAKPKTLLSGVVVRITQPKTEWWQKPECNEPTQDV